MGSDTSKSPCQAALPLGARMQCSAFCHDDAVYWSINPSTASSCKGLEQHQPRTMTFVCARFCFQCSFLIQPRPSRLADAWFLSHSISMTLYQRYVVSSPSASRDLSFMYRKYCASDMTQNSCLASSIANVVEPSSSTIPTLEPCSRSIKLNARGVLGSGRRLTVTSEYEMLFRKSNVHFRWNGYL